MITITEKAAEKMKEIAAQENKPATLRFGVVGGGCSGFSYSINFDTERTPMDKTINVHGVSVLVDGVSYTYLNGTTVDYKETLEESGFHFDNPNAKTTCGCGKSFGA